MESSFPHLAQGERLPAQLRTTSTTSQRQTADVSLPQETLSREALATSSQHPPTTTQQINDMAAYSLPNVVSRGQLVRLVPVTLHTEIGSDVHPEARYAPASSLHNTYTNEPASSTLGVLPGRGSSTTRPDFTLPVNWENPAYGYERRGLRTPAHRDAAVQAACVSDVPVPSVFHDEELSSMEANAENRQLLFPDPNSDTHRTGVTINENPQVEHRPPPVASTLLSGLRGTVAHPPAVGSAIHMQVPPGMTVHITSSHAEGTTVTTTATLQPPPPVRDINTTEPVMPIDSTRVERTSVFRVGQRADAETSGQVLSTSAHSLVVNVHVHMQPPTSTPAVAAAIPSANRAVLTSDAGGVRGARRQLFMADDSLSTIDEDSSAPVPRGVCSCDLVLLLFPLFQPTLFPIVSLIVPPVRQGNTLLASKAQHCSLRLVSTSTLLQK